MFMVGVLRSHVLGKHYEEYVLVALRKIRFLQVVVFFYHVNARSVIILIRFKDQMVQDIISNFDVVSGNRNLTLCLLVGSYSEELRGRQGVGRNTAWLTTSPTRWVCTSDNRKLVQWTRKPPGISQSAQSGCGIIWLIPGPLTS